VSRTAFAGKCRSSAAALVAVLATGIGPATAQTEVFLPDAEASRIRIHLGRAGLLGFLGHDHTIEAPLSRGRIEVAPGNPEGSRVDLQWKAASLAVVPGTEPAEDIPEVEERMRGPDVLHVEEYPEIRLWSFEVRVEEESDAGRWSLDVKAGLELKAERHTVELPLEVRIDGDELVATGEVKLYLNRLGIEPPSVAGVVNVANEFRVSFEVRAARRMEASEGGVAGKPAESPGGREADPR
jgi:polyisoprenoid-binding protein YceI